MARSHPRQAPRFVAGLTGALVLACGGRTALRGAGADGGPTGFCAPSVLAPSGACAQATCAGGECTAVLFTGVVTDVAADDTSVFWTTDSSVMKASSCGADVVTLATCTSPDAIVVDSDGIYVTTLDGALVKIPKQGGAPVVLATFADRAVGLAVSNGVVYWTTRNEATQQGALRSVPAAGGAAAALFSGPIDPGLAVDATAAYFASDRALTKLYLDGTGSASLADNQLIQSIAVDPTNVYWDDGCGRVEELNVPGLGDGLLSSGSSSLLGREPRRRAPVRRRSRARRRPSPSTRLPSSGPTGNPCEA